MRVLLVDDESELVSALAERLSFRDIEADWADTGHKAIDLAKASRYDVAVLDVKMPGLGGFALRDKLHAIQPDMKFIFLSGHGSQEDYTQGSLKASSYLIKPVNIGELVEKIRTA